MQRLFSVLASALRPPWSTLAFCAGSASLAIILIISNNSPVPELLDNQQKTISELQQNKHEQGIRLADLQKQLAEEEQKLITIEELQQSQISELESQLKHISNKLETETRAKQLAQQSLRELNNARSPKDGPIGQSTLTPGTSLNTSTLPLQQTLEASKAIFSLHWEANSPVLKDLNRPKYEQVLHLWQDLANKLALHPSLSKETAQLQLSIIQAQLARGVLPSSGLDNISWESAGLSARRAEVETRLWFTAATIAKEAQQYNKANDYLLHCIEALKKETPQTKSHNAPHRQPYITAMVELLRAELAEQTNPSKALEHYLIAVKHLKEVTTSQPALVHLRTQLARTYIDSSVASSYRNRLTEKVQLQQKASQEIKELIKQHPDLSLPHKLHAELTLIQAQNQVTIGQQKEALKSLKAIQASLKKAGGDPLIQAGTVGIQAFQLWETGKITGAIKLMDDSIHELKKLLEKDPSNLEIQYRIAISLWERSAMRVDINDGLKDSTEASKILVHLINTGAGKREASVRRTLAILYGDIGQIATESNQKNIAKQYFKQSLKHWQFLHDHWDSGSEYSEGLRWCKHKLRSL